MITERYTRWVAMLAQSDTNLVLLFIIAVAVVFVWHVIDIAPAPWAVRLRLGFMVATVGVLLLTVLPRIEATPLQVMVAGVVLWAGLELILERRRRRLAAIEQTGG